MCIYVNVTLNFKEADVLGGDLEKNPTMIGRKKPVFSSLPVSFFNTYPIIGVALKSINLFIKSNRYKATQKF